MWVAGLIIKSLAFAPNLIIGSSALEVSWNIEMAGKTIWLVACG
jgi:hypothetical protein